MIYRQSFDKGRLMELDINEALDCIRAELAENLLAVNNEYCEDHFDKIADVFTGFPAGKTYDAKIEPVIPIANDIINYGYALYDVTDDIKRRVLNEFFIKREELKALMENL